MQDWTVRFPMLAPVLAGADHVDVHAAHSGAELREFIASMMSYQPGWVSFLYGVRKWFVALLGMRQEGIPRAPRWRPENVPMRPGETASFFTVRASEEDRYWLVDIEERHLRAALSVVRDAQLYSIVTIVHYRHWTGRLYFNVIRPFHHLVVRGMARAGSRGVPHFR